MAMLTPLTPDDADRIARAYDLGDVRAVEPLAAGSVNSNFFFTTARGRYFLRLYEEQGPAGVAFEWRLLDHLTTQGVPVPRRLTGVAPDALSVEGRPVALFERMEGFERCRRMVDATHMAAVGDALARVHRASEGFAMNASVDRFAPASLRARLATVDVVAHPELADDVRRLDATLAALPSPALPKGIVHGDLFRDNVRWQGDTILALLDWESASRGVFAFDVMVVCLAWCWGDALDLSLAQAFAQAYHRVRPLTDAERHHLGDVARGVCARFATTRITDFWLRGGPSTKGFRDYRRFLARLDAMERYAPGALASTLLGE